MDLIMTIGIALIGLSISVLGYMHFRNDIES